MTQAKPVSNVAHPVAAPTSPVTHPTHLAVLDDEIDITRLLGHYLQSQGFRVTELHNGSALMELMGRDAPALVLLDLGLPGEDGFAIARQLREHWHCGLVIVTGRGDAIDKVVGLEVGADDYVTKPFDLRELVARVKAVLRRAAAPAEESEGAAVGHGGIQVDPGRHEVLVKGKPVTLTATEFRLLHTLIRRPGQVFTRDRLIDGAIGEDAHVVDRTIDVHVTALRKKLGKAGALIETVRGVGYKLPRR